PQSRQILRDLGIDRRVGPFKVGESDQGWAAVTGSSQVDHVGVALIDQAVEVDVEEAEAWGRAPVAEQSRLDVLRIQRLSQERIVEQVDLGGGQVVGGVPITVHLLQLRWS